MEEKTVYQHVKEFKKRHPRTVAWRIYQNSKIIEDHLNPGEKVLYAFAGQKSESMLDIFSTAVVVVTNKRLLTGFKRILFGYSLSSVTPDLFNDLLVYAGIFFGKITIDTVKETIVISNLAKTALDEIETQITENMIREKKKYARRIVDSSEI